MLKFYLLLRKNLKLVYLYTITVFCISPLVEKMLKKNDNLEKLIQHSPYSKVIQSIYTKLYNWLNNVYQNLSFELGKKVQNKI